MSAGKPRQALPGSDALPLLVPATLFTSRRTVHTVGEQLRILRQLLPFLGPRHERVHQRVNQGLATIRIEQPPFTFQFLIL
jgi:hypothetical protein